MNSGPQRDDATQIDAIPIIVRMPVSDIDTCLRTPPWFAVLTAINFLLVISDIPRTGSAYFAQDYRQPVRPGVSMYWGPYDYHIGHLSLMPNNTILGTRDNKKLDALDVWPYKHDTLSIGPRAMVDYLNITSYPPCITYRGRCSSSKIELATAFTMLDGLVQSIQDKLFQDPAFEPQPFSFTTWSNWVDRLHHRVYLGFTRNAEMRSHDLYHLSSRKPRQRVNALNLCGHRNDAKRRTFSREAMPMFCADPIKWSCLQPSNSASKHLVPLWEHVAIRMSDLQGRYANLELDFTMFITTLKEKSQSHQLIVPSISFITDSLEITTLIRGRQCEAHGECRTVFIDDYRYERASIESNEEGWVPYVVALRWASQGYVWIRVVFLCVGCYIATSSDEKHRLKSIRFKLLKTGAAILKIPGNIITHGSWIPLIGYSLAHYLDSCLVQTIGEFAWSSVGGLYAFKPVDYVMAASIQMRNIWTISLIWKVLFAVRDAVSVTRSAPRALQRDGLAAFRGVWFGIIAWLTTFGLMRALHFRDTNIVRVLPLSRHTATSFVHVERNNSDYGFQFDVKCTFAAVIFLFCSGWVLQKFVRLVTGRETSFFFSRSFYVPYSAGTLWSPSQLDTFWLVRFRGETNTAPVYADANATFARLILKAKPPLPVSSSSITPETQLPPLKKKSCPVCGFASSVIHWRSTQGCLDHELSSTSTVAPRRSGPWCGS